MKKYMYLILSMVLFSSSAQAYKECTVQIDRLYTGDDGHLWLFFKNGGAAYIQQDNVNFRNIYSMVLAAHMANRVITVRFVSDAAVCNQGTRTDLQGVFLESN